LLHSALGTPPGEFLQPIAQALPVPIGARWPTIPGVPALIGLGLSHHTAPLAVRERLALPALDASGLLRALLRTGAVEAVALSTCNRTELYLVGDDAGAAEGAGLRALARRAGMTPGALRAAMTVLRGPEAVDHLFAVAAGLESMVLGEAEILGQLRRAHELSRAAEACGPIVDRLLRDALAAGRRARAETAIGRCGVSVSSAAVELAREALGSLAGRNVLLVGAGKSSEVTAKVLRSHGVGRLCVANRRRERAVALAGRDGDAVAFEELDDRLAGADLVLTATASPRALIDAAAVRGALARRGGRPLVLVDLAVPRDVDPAVRGIDGVTLVDLDDVQRRVARNRDARRGEVGRARAILATEVERFERWRAAREAAPTVAALQGAGEAIVSELLDRNAPHWQSMSAADRERVADMARALARRLLHEPTLRLKQAARDGDPAPGRAVRELFGLEGGVAAAPQDSVSAAVRAR
jgi:glutamyl-tRNA reductase